MSKIEMIEPEWRPPAAQAAFEHMQAEIAKAFALPRWALQSADAHARFMRQAHEATERMRQEAIKIYTEHCFPRAIIKNEE